MTPYIPGSIIQIPEYWIIYRRFIKRKMFIASYVGNRVARFRSVQKLFKDAQFTIERQKRLIYVVLGVENYQLNFVYFNEL